MAMFPFPSPPYAFDGTTYRFASDSTFADVSTLVLVTTGALAGKYTVGAQTNVDPAQLPQIAKCIEQEIQQDFADGAYQGSRTVTAVGTSPGFAVVTVPDSPPTVPVTITPGAQTAAWATAKAAAFCVLVRQITGTTRWAPGDPE